MPFGFGKKKDEAGTAPAAPRDVAPVAPRTIRFRGFTEEWRLDGAIALSGRLIDLLNQRDAIPITDVQWAPVDGNAALEPAPGIQTVDPYDVIVVLAGADTLLPQTDQERAAHRIHKVRFDVALVAPPFRVIGSVHVHPGAVPESLLDRGTQMFAAITDPEIRFGEDIVEIGETDTVLVNRFYLREVVQVDRATGIPYANLPPGLAQPRNG